MRCTRIRFLTSLVLTESPEKLLQSKFPGSLCFPVLDRDLSVMRASSTRLLTTLLFMGGHRTLFRSSPHTAQRHGSTGDGRPAPHQQSGVRPQERQNYGRCSDVKEEPAKRPPAARRGEGYAREVDDAPARKGNGLGVLRDQSPDPGVIFVEQRGRILPQRTLRSKHR